MGVSQVSNLMVPVLPVPAAVNWGTEHPPQECQGSAEGGLELSLSLSASVSLNVKMKPATSLFKFGDLCDFSIGTLNNNDIYFITSISYQELKKSPVCQPVLCKSSDLYQWQGLLAGFFCCHCRTWPQWATGLGQRPSRPYHSADGNTSHFGTASLIIPSQTEWFTFACATLAVW